MANIYLKVPTYIAQFYRGRDPEHPLTEFDPVEFSIFQQESVVMSAGVSFVAERDMEHTFCFSQRMWNNMLNGRPPQGGSRVFRREPTQWLSMAEINTLTGVKSNKKNEGSEYLCIRAPKTILIGTTYHQVSTSYTMSARMSNELVRCLRKHFIFRLVKWLRDEQELCVREGILRDVVLCIDHFFYHYGICAGTNLKDRDSMRRMAIRWLEIAKTLGTDIQDEDVNYIYDREKEAQGPSIDSFINDLQAENESVNE